MPEAHFADPRLADIYEIVDSDRSDLSTYVALVDELGAGSILDVGCGTGSFATLLAGRGVRVIGLDPAEASLAVGRRKPHAHLVNWIMADAAALPDVEVDLLTMTGNVAQVFLDDDGWLQALRNAHRCLRPGGHLVFEVRNPARGAWREWAREQTFRHVSSPDHGVIETWLEVTEANLPFVAFRSHYIFKADGAALISESTLRFRGREEIEDALESVGFDVREVRDAPDRRGKEWIFIAQRLR